MRNRLSLSPRVAAGILVFAISCAAGSPSGGAETPSTKGSAEKSAPTTAPAPAAGPTAASAPGGAATPGGAAPAAVDPVVARTKAVGDAIAAFLNAIGWAIVALVLLLVFRRQLVELLTALATAMQDRGVTLDVFSVKVQVTERVLDASDERVVLFSGLPFEIAEESSLDRPAVLGEISPQQKFQVTDTVAQYWKTTHGPDAERLSAARDKLETVCRGMHDFGGARTALVEFARALEASRFLNAGALVDLLDRDPILGEGIRSLQPGDLPAAADDYLILHGAGVAYSQRSRWANAMELLGKIAWRGEHSLYLPAADTWLACAYHAALEAFQKEHPDRDFEQLLPELSTAVKTLLTQGRGLALAMDSDEVWKTLPSSGANVGYYRREVQKSIGEIASILWDYAALEDKPSYRQEAEGALKRCCEEIAHEPPSPLDWNNLADVYRQQGKYAEAHQTLDRAGPQVDPAFDNTRALIFHGEKKPLQGLLALQRYGEAQASAASDQDVAQYVENQILAAKLAAAVEPRMSPPYLALAADLLEGVRHFVDGSEQRHKTVDDTLCAEIDELLSFTYLQLPGRETTAVDAFARLAQRGYGGGAEVRWRRRLGHARALTRLARSQRRNFSADNGGQYRKRAAEVLADSGEALKRFGLDTGVPLARRDHHLRLHLDTAIAWQGLAEETFSQGAWQAARDVSDHGGTILSGLETILATDHAFLESLGPAKATILESIRLSRARRGFLLGRILIRSDPGLREAGLIASVERNFASARGVGGELECAIDLELGELMLAAALSGAADTDDLYRRAVTSLELATTREAPHLRSEALRALADAYARRGAVQRRKKKAPKAST